MTDPAKILPANVAEALKAGNKIEAIKRLRESSGIGLAEAKAIAEGYGVHEASYTPSPSRRKAAARSIPRRSSSADRRSPPG